MNKASSISVCVFGSYARNQSDVFSDKDVLIVGNEKKIAEQEIASWKKKGWSVAFYTWSRLEKMVLSRSLFVQHLKQDGILKIDQSNRLRSVLDSYVPKPCYKMDLMSAEDMVRPLDRIPVSIWEGQMQCDVLYTYTRNAGILELASLGIYEFEYPSIIKNLAEIYSLTEIEVKSLIQLRAIKAQYRARQKTHLDYSEILSISRETISRMFDIKFNDLETGFGVRLLRVPYATLREIEARMISYSSPIYLDGLATNTVLGKYWKYVTDPRQYSWSVKSINGDDLRTLNENITRFSKVRFSA